MEIIYIHGKDNCYRFLFCLNPGLFTSIDCDLEGWEKLMFFILDFLINKYLLSTKVENWNIIAYLGDLSKTNIPYQLKDIFSGFKVVYRCRLFKIYLLNMNFIFNFFWNMVKLIMGPTFEAKASNVDANDGECDLLFQNINRSQVE